VGASLRDYAGAIQASPERLADVEDRLAAIDRPQAQVRANAGCVLKFGAEASRKLQRWKTKTKSCATCGRSKAPLLMRISLLQKSLSKTRKDAAKKA